MGKRSLPEFDKLSSLYLGDGWTAQQIKEMIGGTINRPEIDDTCIVRMSYALNWLGHLIPPWSLGFRTRRGADKRWYGLRVKEFWPWMVKTYGEPTVSTKGNFSRGAISNIRGIIGFRVAFGDHSATGHFTLWDGTRLLYGERDSTDYFSDSDESALWQIDLVPTI